MPGVSVALREAYEVWGWLVQPMECCQCSQVISLLSLSLSFSGRKPHASLPVTASSYWSFFLLPQVTVLPVHPCQKSPLPPAVASSSCCGLRSFCSPELLLLWAREGSGQGRGKVFSCGGERDNVSKRVGRSQAGEQWQRTLEVELGGLGQCGAQTPDLLSPLFIQSRDPGVLSSQLP